MLFGNEKLIKLYFGLVPAEKYSQGKNREKTTRHIDPFNMSFNIFLIYSKQLTNVFSTYD